MHPNRAVMIEGSGYMEHSSMYDKVQEKCSLDLDSFVSMGATCDCSIHSLTGRLPSFQCR